ncbi:MAG: 4Fe-4S dicluster domain-containing protein [Bacteroidota bacterium]
MNNNTDHSLSIANPDIPLDGKQKLGLGIAGLGLLVLFLAWFGVDLPNPGFWLGVSSLLLILGAVVYGYTYMDSTAGIKNNHIWFRSLINWGVAGWVLGVFLTGFYCLLYWAPQYLGYDVEGSGAANSGLVALFDPLSQLFKNQPASQWFVYGTLYTIAIVGLGFKFIAKYRHNRYQIIRTISVMFFQLGFAWLLPEFLLRMSLPYNDFKNMWPLNYYFFHDWSIQGMIQNGSIGMFMLIWGLAMMFIISPVLTYFYGKRWYCSWVCGCGGLAETAGDPFRHLSDKSLTAWKFERWIIYSVLVAVTVVTIAILYVFLKNTGENLMISHTAFAIFVIACMALLAGGTWVYRDKMTGLDYKIRNAILIIAGVIAGFTILAMITGGSNIFIINTYELTKWYGLIIGALFAGVIGVGFYPLMGSRVWCRFGCPMAAILGLQQKFFSRFRITVNGGQCISCGNCSTYCEMGIDVRAYAQKGQDIVRSSCVGCGICAAVCPRGVLRLENGSVDIDNRTKDLRTVHIPFDKVGIL